MAVGVLLAAGLAGWLVWRWQKSQKAFLRCPFQERRFCRPAKRVKREGRYWGRGFRPAPERAKLVAVMEGHLSFSSTTRLKDKEGNFSLGPVKTITIVNGEMIASYIVGQVELLDSLRGMGRHVKKGEFIGWLGRQGVAIVDDYPLVLTVGRLVKDDNGRVVDLKVLN